MCAFELQAVILFAKVTQMFHVHSLSWLNILHWTDTTKCNNKDEKSISSVVKGKPGKRFYIRVIKQK